MEIFLIILGLIMIYSWTHGTVIVLKKIRKTTSYEQVVLWVGFTSFLITVIGIIAE